MTVHLLCIGTVYMKYVLFRHQTLGYRTIQDGFQTLLVGESRSTGELDVVATIDGGMLGKLELFICRFYLEQASDALLGFGSVSGELKLNLVDDASVDQASISVFNHPKNQEFVNVRQGSGYFEIDNSNGGVVESSYVPFNRTVSIHPLADGDATLTVRDLCLPTNRSPSVKVHVSGVRKVKLLVSDKVQRGKSISAQVKLLDRHDKQLAASAHSFLKVALTSASSHVKVQPTQDPLQFNIVGSELGETTLTASVASGGPRVSSAQAPVQVFPPLELEPRNLTLIVGAKFQVKAIGGPMPGMYRKHYAFNPILCFNTSLPFTDSSIEFHMANGKVADSNSAGLVEALTLGHSKLVGRAIAVDKVTNKKVVLSEDQVDVHVVKLHGVRINTPVSRLRVGAEMPVTVVGLDASNQNTFSFATALPEIQLEWSATNTVNNYELECYFCV